MKGPEAIWEVSWVSGSFILMDEGIRKHCKLNLRHIVKNKRHWSQAQGLNVMLGGDSLFNLPLETK